MSLTGRFSTLFQALLAFVLLGSSAALYVTARVYLDRQVRDRLTAALAVLTATAEVHPRGVEWEPQERVLPLGQETGPDRLRWMVFDDQGRRVDHSRNLANAEVPADWTPRAGTTRLPGRLRDGQGRAWRVSQRRLSPAAFLGTGSKAAANPRPPDDAEPRVALFPSLVLTVCAPLAPMEATLTALAGFLVVVDAGIWLVAALLCRRLSRKALLPLRRMVESARGLDAADPGWCLEEAGTGDELEDLGRAFNELLSRLHVAYERQRRFSSDASHQLRTPLTVLTGQIEVALRQERSGDEYRRVLKSALGRAVQLRQILEALLFLARADADARLPESEPVELNEWVGEQLASRNSASHSSHVVHQTKHAAALWVRVHPALLGQLLDNLLDNAAKYGRPGTTIRVQTLREGHSAILAVEDDGPGIAPEDVAYIFEPFYRSAEARYRGTPGVGLGLAVVQRIAGGIL